MNKDFDIADRGGGRQTGLLRAPRVRPRVAGHLESDRPTSETITQFLEPPARQRTTHPVQTTIQ